MKRLLRIFLLVLVFASFSQLVARAYTTNDDGLNIPIPDADTNGIQNSLSINGLSGPMQHVSVTLNITGGFNGDFYAYLFHNGTNSILLNRVGVSSTSTFGYSDRGFGPDGSGNRFTFNDSAAHDIHYYQTFPYTLNGNGQLTGQWQPDGRAIDPSSSGAAFDSAARTRPLSDFIGLDPNGTWSLFIADMSPLGAGVLSSWGMTIDVVPEPASGVLLVLGLSGFWVAVRSKQSVPKTSS
ncbi:MAG: PEP-CTERM sorting domain-containing protein [Verrucomicrobia bacterium]|nr:MAG: PEP-CTERM sorting domain-containing protein [Verrucomicrobiota bacterium]